MIKHLETVNLIVKSTLVQDLKRNIHKRFKGIFDNISNVSSSENTFFTDFSWFIASFLDPTMKFYWLEIADLSETKKRTFESCLKTQIKKNGIQ